MKKTDVLYISIIGMSEPLGKSQVLEYLQDLSGDYNISLYSFEKNLDPVVLQEIDKMMDKYGIDWSYRLYSNKYGVFSTIIQIVNSLFVIKNLIKNKQIKIIHARSLIPVLIALPFKTINNVKVVFDIRGFQTDEKAEVGRIKHGSILYKALKFIEKYAYRKSDAVVVLTNASKQIICKVTDEEKVTVIPTCANNRVFKVITNDEKKVFKEALGYKASDRIVIHAGTVSNWYDFDSELLLMTELMQKDKSIHFLILNKGEHEFIKQKLDEYNLDGSKVNVTEVGFYDMYKYLNIADASLFIIKPTYAKIASAPTKFAENLACSLFSITNNGIGDMDIFFSEHPEVGYSFDIEALESSLDELSDTILQQLAIEKKDIKEFGLLYNKSFSKEMAIEKYSAIYDALVK